LRKTYGVSTIKPFEKGVHDESKKVLIAGRPGMYWCTDFFDKFASYGEVVNINKSVERVYSPQTADQTCMNLVMYSTPLPDPGYITDKMVIVGHIRVDMSDVRGGLARSVKVNFFFGLSAFKITATESNSGVIKVINVNYEGASTVKDYHIIFLNDTSGSMQSRDIAPSLPWITHHNRVGALYEACYTLLKEREKCNDFVSFIGYDNTANIEFSNMPLKDSAEKVVLKMCDRFAAGGTNYLEPIKLLGQVFQNNPVSKKPIVFMMTDGECNDGGASKALQDLMLNFDFSLHTVLISNEKNDHEVLQKLAEIGKGKFFHSVVTLEEMKQTYSKLVAHNNNNNAFLLFAPNCCPYMNCPIIIIRKQTWFNHFNSRHTMGTFNFQPLFIYKRVEQYTVVHFTRD